MSIWAKYRSGLLALVLTLVAGLLVVAPVQARPKPPKVSHAMKQGLKQVGRKAHRQLARAAKHPKAHAAWAVGDGYINAPGTRCTWGAKVEYEDGSQTGRSLVLSGQEPIIYARGSAYAQTIAMRWGVVHKREGAPAWENWTPWRYTMVTKTGIYLHGAAVGMNNFYWWEQNGRWAFGPFGMYWEMTNPDFANTANQGAIQVAWWNQNTAAYTTQTAFVPNLDGSYGACFLQADSF